MRVPTCIIYSMYLWMGTGSTCWADPPPPPPPSLVKTKYLLDYFLIFIYLGGGGFGADKYILTIQFLLHFKFFNLDIWEQLWLSIVTLLHMGSYYIIAHEWLVLKHNFLQKLARKQ